MKTTGKFLFLISMGFTATALMAALAFGTPRAAGMAITSDMVSALKFAGFVLAFWALVWGASAYRAGRRSPAVVLFLCVIIGVL